MAAFIGIIHKEGEGEYTVSFPDFPGCRAAAESLDEAVRMAGEALRGHLSDLREAGEAVPGPMSLEEARGRTDDGVAAFIVVQAPDHGRRVRVNITLRESELQRIDEGAARAHQSRSAFLVTSALQAARG
jgi:predicted RNase H-like HicB family nuclease